MKQRLEYIDALRGLAILLVVFMHVPQYGFGESVGGFYMECASMLAVPLFFFISGFVTDAKLPPPNLKTYGKRGRVILLPTIVIGLFYAALNHIELGSLVTDKFKAGFWFTITLFEYYLIHDFVRLLSFQRQRVYDGLSVAVALGCYAVALPSVQILYQDSVFLQVLGVSQWKYFIFFVLGMWARRFSHILQTGRFGKGILLVFLLIYGGNEIWKVELSGFWFNVNLLLKESFIVLLAYTLFFKYQRVLSGKARLGRMMTLLGTNTLEIYLLHYFVLPRHLDAFLDMEALVVNPMIAMYADLLVSLLVIGVVLAIVYILSEHKNNPLRHLRAKGDGD